ncbi:uncharacterized protein LOC142150092 isoform X2 [Mixophyes fleayi]|uniref:uncharacterized protein LOC142150092 isoform X2 n=1 Tax=Mixophyes fleayi TaxID=3061075 RepID=UPI003F4DB033
MWTVIMVMSVLYTLGDTNEKCLKHECENSANQTCKLKWSNYQKCKALNFSHSNIIDIVDTENVDYSLITNLDLSYNKLRNLAEGFLSNAGALKEINLGNNNLEHLPTMFLNRSFSLQVVSLEGNPLSEIPASILQSELFNLTVDCRCDVGNSLKMYLSKNATDHSRLSINCKMSSSWSTLVEFYTKNCGMHRLLVLYIVLAIVALGFIIGGVALYMRNRKKRLAAFDNKATTDQSPAHGQPRYTSRNTDGTATTLNQGQRQDYENVFVGHLPTVEIKPYDYLEEQSGPGAHSKHRKEEDIYLESDVHEGDQPIYSNTQGVYYNYTDSSQISNKYKEEDDVYILPDQ